MAAINRDGSLDYEDFPDWTAPPPAPPKTNMPGAPGTVNPIPPPNAAPAAGDNPYPDAADMWKAANNDPQQFYMNFGNKYFNGKLKQSAPNGGGLDVIANQLSTLSGNQWGVWDPKTEGDAKYYKGLKDPNGNFIKTLDGSDQMIWLPNGDYGGGGAAGGTAGATGGGLESILMQMLQGSQADKAATAADRKALSTRLNGLLDKYSKPVSASDPEIAANVEAYHGTSARSLADFREMAAERAHAEGVPSGAFDAQLGNATMAAGRAEGTLQANLMSGEYQARRQALSDILNQSGGNLNDADRMSIQSQISSIDGLLKGQGLNLESTRIGNQDTQFYDKLASDQAENANGLDQILTTLLLGGGGA